MLHSLLIYEYRFVVYYGHQGSQGCFGWTWLYAYTCSVLFSLIFLIFSPVYGWILLWVWYLIVILRTSSLSHLFWAHGSILKMWLHWVSIFHGCYLSSFSILLSLFVLIKETLQFPGNCFTNALYELRFSRWQKWVSFMLEEVHRKCQMKRT